MKRVPLIVLGFFNFHFPIELIGGQCFVEARVVKD